MTSPTFNNKISTPLSKDYNVLYITYDGLTDPLGQSQILPYLKGLSQKGYNITILSCEKKENFIENQSFVLENIQKYNIQWEYIFYSQSFSILSSLWNLFQLKRKAFYLHKKNKFKIVHCRSYIPSLIGLEMKQKFKLKFIFDMRGFWADERVEGGLWNLKNPLYKIIYNYFKKKETEFLEHSDYTISLTEKAKNIIHNWQHIPNQPIPIEVIPCCVDIEHFSREKISHEKLGNLRKNLGINTDDLILCYLGSIGTWYMLDDMLIFFSRLLMAKPNMKFLFITPENEKVIFNAANEIGIPKDKIVVTKASYNNIPYFLALSHFSIFFIRPTFSKTASSPTKQGEVMSMGIPIICNVGIGDTDTIIVSNNYGIVINTTTANEYENIIMNFDRYLNIPPEKIRQGAIEYFSLERGIEKYNKIYQSLLNRNFD